MSAPTAAATRSGSDASPARAGFPERTLWQRAADSGWTFLAPFLAVYGLFLIWPLLNGLWMSFTDATLNGAGGDFVGFANYIEALGDPLVWTTLGNTAFFTLITTVPLVAIALAMAVLVHTGLPGQWLWRLSFFLPFLLPVATVALVWNYLYVGDFGLLNQALGILGAEGVGWLTDEGTAMWSIAITTVWWTVGFNFLLYLTALQNIPDHLYEAAALDGAGRWRRLVSITLPQLAPTTVLVLVLQMLASLKVFDQIYQMTDGGPGGDTRPILLYVYEVGFTGYRLGYASAISYIFFFLIIIVSIAYMVISSRRSVKA